MAACARRRALRFVPLPGLRKRWHLAVCLLCLACLPLSIFAQDRLAPPTEPEAWLVTYGPGEIYWQRFGHNAIWLREPGGLDHTFNYGFFDFEQENFLLRFVQGRMLYFAAAMPAEQELALYASEGREVRLQRLDLDAAAYARLREHLLRNVQPENRDYLYDYYLDNCSTRIRDALDLALNGALAATFRDRPAAQSLRAHTRRSTQADRDYYLGLVMALGLPIDRPIDRWTEQFLPARLADGLREVSVAREGKAKPLVTEERVLIPGLVSPAPAVPATTWPFYLFCALGFVALLMVLLRSQLAGLGRALILAWLSLAGVLGLAMLAVWAFTDHVAANPNFNLLLLQPLALLAWLPSLRKALAVLLLLGVVLVAALALWPGGQYLADTLALFGTLNLAAAVWLLRSRRRPVTPAAILSRD